VEVTVVVGVVVGDEEEIESGGNDVERPLRLPEEEECDLALVGVVVVTVMDVVDVVDAMLLIAVGAGGGLARFCLKVRSSSFICVGRRPHSSIAVIRSSPNHRCNSLHLKGIRDQRIDQEKVKRVIDNKLSCVCIYM
jgi:hypothetical protein